MPDLIIRKRPSETGIPPNLVLYGTARGTPSESVSVDISWRWEDEEEMKWQPLGSTTPGNTLSVPFDPKGREVRLRMVPKNEFGVESSQAVETVFGPGPSLELATMTVIAGENLTARSLVDLYQDGPDIKARHADATDNTRPAEAFIADAVGSGDDVLVYFSGNVNNGLSGLTPGLKLYLSETPGGVTHTPITTGVGKLVQEVGHALSASSMIFEPQIAVELNS